MKAKIATDRLANAGLTDGRTERDRSQVSVVLQKGKRATDRVRTINALPVRKIDPPSPKASPART
jgi:hypothetical protein